MAAELTDAKIIDVADDFKSQYQACGVTVDQFDYFGFARAIWALATQQATQGAEPVGGAERWMAIVREKADDARKNAQGLRQFEGMEAEARARELAAQYLLETAHVMVLDERHAEALANIVDQSERLARLRAAITAPPPTAEVEKKAARYDWLRALPLFGAWDVTRVRPNREWLIDSLRADDLDAAIDAAIQSDPKPT